MTTYLWSRKPTPMRGRWRRPLAGGFDAGGDHCGCPYLGVDPLLRRPWKLPGIRDCMAGATLSPPSIRVDDDRVRPGPGSWLWQLTA